MLVHFLLKFTLKKLHEIFFSYLFLVGFVYLSNINIFLALIVLYLKMDVKIYRIDGLLYFYKLYLFIYLFKENINNNTRDNFLNSLKVPSHYYV